jgi:RNA polymerase sigma factor (sigma-70 family)
MDLNVLVDKAQNGDDSAMREICLRFTGLVKKYAFQRHLRLLVSEAVSEGWLAVVQAVRTYDQRCGVPFAGYVESRVKYALWNLFKRERRRWENEWLLDDGRDQEEGVGLLDTLAAKVDVAKEVEVEWLSKTLRQAISELAPRQRQAIADTLLSDQSLTATARKMGVTVQAAHKLRQRGLAHLKAACAGLYQPIPKRTN